MADEKKVYPYWYQPDPNVGAVLIKNEKEEKEITSALDKNIADGAAQREKDEADAKRAQDDATVAEANRIKAERRG